MSGFLKSFLENEKSPEERALISQPQRKMRDVMTIADFAMDEDEEEEAGNCGGCSCGAGGCGG